MPLASTPDPGRPEIKADPLAKRVFAGLIRDMRQPFGCVRVPEPGRPARTSR